VHKDEASMPIDPRRGYGNILVTRLHRHSQVATLFRSVEPGISGKAANRAGFTSPPGISQVPVVRASLAEPESDLPWGDVIDNESFGDAALFQASAAVQAAEAPPQARPEMPSSRKDQPAPEKPSLQEESSSKDQWQPGSEDSAQQTSHPAWQRLEDIYQSQQAQVQQDQAAGAGLPLPVQRQPETPAPQAAPVSPRSEKTGAIQPARSSPNLVQKQPGGQAVPPTSLAPSVPVNPPAQPASKPADSHSETAITDDVWRRLQAIYRAHEEKNKQERENAPQQAEKAPELSKSVQKSPAVRPAPTIPPAPKIVELQPDSPLPAKKLTAAPLPAVDQTDSRSVQGQQAASQAAQQLAAAPSSLADQAASQPAVQERPSDSQPAQQVSAPSPSTADQPVSQPDQEQSRVSQAAQQVSASPLSPADEPVSQPDQEQSRALQPADLEIGSVPGSADSPAGKAEALLPPIKIAKEPPIQAQPAAPDLTGSPTPPKPAPSRAERAWQRLQNIFGRRPEIESAEPVDSARQAVSPTPTPAAVELPETQPLQRSRLPEMPAVQEAMPASIESTAGVQAEPEAVSETMQAPTLAEPEGEQPISFTEETAVAAAKGEVAVQKEAAALDIAPETFPEGRELVSQSTLQAEPVEPPEQAALAAAHLAEDHPDVPAAPTVSQETPAVIQPTRTGSQAFAVDNSSAATQITTRPSQAPVPPQPTIPAGLISSEDDFETEAAEISPDEVQQQSVPLEAIWPVERRDFPTQEKARSTETTRPGAAVPPMELPAEDVAEIHRMLETVQPGQATDSKVEVITPPRPRPAPAPTPPSFDQDKPLAEELLAAPELPVVQRSADSEPSKTQPAAMGGVPQNLTPELAKLWGMLDGMETRQAEPAGPTQADISYEPQSSLTASQALAAAIQRAEAPSQPEPHPSVEKHETSSITEPLPVQRQAEPPAAAPADAPAAPAAAAAPTAAAPAAEETGGAAGQAGKPDIDALARQVYSEVRRKLALEWERMRR
jgi:hypothetical protein